MALNFYEDLINMNWIRKHRSELIIIFLFCLFAFGFNIYRIQGDGAFYYNFLERILNIPDPETSADNGFMQSGCAYFNAPFYLAAYTVERVFHKKWDWRGITLRAVAINLASNFYVILSILIAVRILRRLKYRHVIIPVTSVLFSTSVFVTAVVMPGYNHAVDVFINTLFIYLFIENEESLPVKSVWLGVLYVITILIRYFNFVLIIPVVIYYLNKRDFRKISFFIAGTISAAWIIPLIFYLYNGAMFSAFAGVKSMEQNISHWTSLYPKYFFKILVHPVHGIFVWSPVLIFSALGLLIMSQDRRKWGYIFGGLWCLHTVMNGLTPTWHGGWSFSIRSLSCLFPVYIIGMAAMLERYGNKVIIPVALCTLFSLFLFFNWYRSIIHGEFGTPFNMIEAWYEGKNYITGEKLDLSIFFQKIWNSCRYKYIFKFFK